MDDAPKAKLKGTTTCCAICMDRMDKVKQRACDDAAWRGMHLTAVASVACKHSTRYRATVCYATATVHPMRPISVTVHPMHASSPVTMALCWPSTACRLHATDAQASPCGRWLWSLVDMCCTALDAPGSRPSPCPLPPAPSPPWPHAAPPRTDVGCVNAASTTRQLTPLHPHALMPLCPYDPIPAWPDALMPLCAPPCPHPHIPTCPHAPMPCPILAVLIQAQWPGPSLMPHIPPLNSPHAYRSALPRTNPYLPPTPDLQPTPASPRS